MRSDYVWAQRPVGEAAACDVTRCALTSPGHWIKGSGDASTFTADRRFTVTRGRSRSGQSDPGRAGALHVARLLLLPAGRCAPWPVGAAFRRNRACLACGLLEQPGLAGPVRRQGGDRAPA